MRGSSLNKKHGLLFVLAALLSVITAFGSVSYALDQYPGDTAIYGVSTGTIQPNVLIIMDNSGSMQDPISDVSAYNKSTTYATANVCDSTGTGACISSKVYKWTASTSTWTSYMNLSTVACSAAKTAFSKGMYIGKLTTAGACSGTSSYSFATGNYINWTRTNSSLITGTVSATNGSKNITGLGTKFTTELVVGDLLEIGGTRYDIATITSTTALTLTSSYSGTTGDGLPAIRLRRKINVAHEVLTNLVNTTTGVKFGLMIFGSTLSSSTEGGHIAGGTSDTYGYVSGGLTYKAYVNYMGATDYFTGTVTNKTALVNTINNIPASTYTPLGETLFEAMTYFKGASPSDCITPAPPLPTPKLTSCFNTGVTYTTPIEYSCQKNYVILITDGMATQDSNAALRTICVSGDCDADGMDASANMDNLDDVAKYIQDTDLLPDTGGDAKTTGMQNITLNTIGFGLGSSDAAAVTLLQQAAFNGGGKYFLASSTAGLSESLRQILATIIKDNTSFVAPTVPISPENRTFSGKRVYMGFFKPDASAFWGGNLKKFGLDDNGNFLDKNGALATDAAGVLKETSESYWSSAADGTEVAAGGVGDILQARDLTTRKIYTYLGATSDLANAANAFSTSNASITFTTMNVVDAAAKDQVVNYVYGYDAYDEDFNGVTTETRGWIMGDVLHSRPATVAYTTYTDALETDCSSNKTLIFVNANDGMLHAFRDCDGGEQWAFIPPDLLPNLQYLKGTTHTYFADAAPVVYTYDANADGIIGAGDKVVLMFGERRGGNGPSGSGYYYALDVTSPTAPKYMWRIGQAESPLGTRVTGTAATLTDYSELAETWSEPQIAKLNLTIGATATDVVAAFIGAGYDAVAEDQQPFATGTKGRGVYAVEIARLSSAGVPSFATSGLKVWGYTYATNSSLARSVPSQLAVLDVDGNGYADRIYALDISGRAWRFDIGASGTGSWTGRTIFAAPAGRKTFYRPAVTFEVGYEMLFFGTGDREHPIDTLTTTPTAPVDRLYAVKDSGQLTAKGETNLSNATSVASVDITATSGWFVALNVNSGEKDLASTTVINKVAYFTTYSPSSSGSAASCTADNRGTARFYAMSYLSAAAAYDLDLGNDAGGVKTYATTDRSKVLGTGIPSGLVVVITPSGITAIIGTGGALVVPPIDKTGSSIPTYWREVH